MSSPGLLLVFGECGSVVSEQEFNDWYDNEHAPARLHVPGFLTAARFRATDSQSPSWLALYDLSSPAVAYSDPYKALAAQASPRERSIIPQLAMLNRRIYTHLSTASDSLDRADISSLPPFLLLFTMSVQPELEEEFNQWYEEHHIPDIAKVPGWRRCRRYKLLDAVELTGKSLSSPEKHTHNYLTLHEWDNDLYADLPEFRAAIRTPKSIQILKDINEYSIRSFITHKVFHE